MSEKNGHGSHNNKAKLRIFLADLVYDTVKTNYVVPLNMGYLAALLDNKSSSQVDIQIFKYPKELESAIKNAPPDVLGLSHYSWNALLDRLFLKMVKRVNPDVVTVMGGPNIRIEPEEIEKFLRGLPDLDHYIIFEGEQPFLGLIQALLAGEPHPEIMGCASIAKDMLRYNPIDQMKKERTINCPSPYLSGWLDPFLKNPEMMPLLESNRGCPFGCVYCSWGISVLSSVRQRPLEIVFQEIDYIAEHSAGQVKWIFCDANFGILPRDLDIARKIRETMDRKGLPVNVTLWYSKNTSKRNTEISEIIGGNNSGYIAIQSSDPLILKHTGRGSIKTSETKASIDYYREKGIPVSTDLLIGLPKETYQSHLQSIFDSFNMGFDIISPYNIRMLPGSSYDSKKSRKFYGVQTKFRPIFGAYGIYDGKRVFEMEESVRATVDMTEDELDDFKILHWLIYFCWNSRIGRLPLELARLEGINPGKILHELSTSPHPILKKTFQGMLNKSREEWFDTREEMLEYYGNPEQFEEMTKNFSKINSLYMAMLYTDQQLIDDLVGELRRLIHKHIENSGQCDKELLDDLMKVTNLSICKNLLEEENRKLVSCCGKAAAIILNDSSLQKHQQVELAIYRPKGYVSLCKHYLQPGGIIDLSLLNLTRFMETEGVNTLTNKIFPA